MTSKEFTLETRPSAGGPVFVGSYQPGDEIGQWTIEAGNQVALRSDGIAVIADVTAAIGDSYKGTIVGFEKYIEEELNGKRVGDTINFRFEHIFSCSR